MNNSPHPITPPGKSPIKQVEMFTKWRDYIDDEYKEETCPEPPAHIMEKVAGEKATKRQRKREAT